MATDANVSDSVKLVCSPMPGSRGFRMLAARPAFRDNYYCTSVKGR